MQFETTVHSDDQIYVDLDGHQDDEQSGIGIWELQVPGLDAPLKITAEYGRAVEAGVGGRLWSRISQRVARSQRPTL